MKKKPNTRPNNDVPVLKQNGIKPLNDVVTLRQFYRTTQDIESWRTAIKQAENIFMPRRILLYRLYRDILLDAQVGTVMDKRIFAILNSRFTFKDSGQKQPTTDQSILDIFDGQWFMDMLRYYMEAKFWGFSLIEFEILNGKIDNCELVRRDNVLPEFGIVSWDGVNPEGIPFREPPYSNYTIEAGKQRDLGLFMSIAQYVIYKRGGFGDWSQFAEIFGMPFREAQYDPYDQASRQKLETAMEDMGSAQWLVTPKGTELKIHETSRSGKNDIYKDLVDKCDEQISKRVLGQTMTTDQGSSRSQGEVHADVEAAINLADKRELLAWLNGKFKAILQGLGYNVANGRFSIEEEVHIALTDRITIDTALNAIIPIDPEYFYDTYNVPAPKSGIPEETKAPQGSGVRGQGSDEEEPDPNDPVEDDKGEVADKVRNDKKEKKLALSVTDAILTALGVKKKSILNRPYLTEGSGVRGQESGHAHKLAFNGPPDGLSDDIIASAKAGQKLSPEQFQNIADQLISGLHLGWKTGSGEGALDYTSKDQQAINMMEANIFKFSAGKSMATNIELNQLARESSSFSEFKGKAATLLGDYNTRYMEAEYNHANAVGQSASAYIQAVNDGMNYWRWQGVMDERERPEHVSVEGMEFPLNEDTASLIPPVDWGCRCEGIYFMKENTKELSTPADFAEALGAEYMTRIRKGGFLTNWADEGEAFSRAQMYISTNFEKGMTLEDMYGSKDMAWSELDKSEFPDGIAGQARNDEAVASVKDYRERDIILGGFKQSLNAVETLANPDEVWMASEGKGYVYRYVKMYKDKMSVVETNFGKGKPAKVKKVTTATSDKYRKGILVKRMK